MSSSFPRLRLCLRLRLCSKLTSPSRHPLESLQRHRRRVCAAPEEKRVLGIVLCRRAKRVEVPAVCAARKNARERKRTRTRNKVEGAKKES